MAPFGTEVDDPIGGFDHVEIVFDNYHGITALVEAMSGMNNQIAAAMEEQSYSTSAINDSLFGIRGITDEAASGMSQITDASAELAELATRLSSLTQHFHTKRR